VSKATQTANKAAGPPSQQTPPQSPPNPTVVVARPAQPQILAVRPQRDPDAAECDLIPGDVPRRHQRGLEALRGPVGAVGVGGRQLRPEEEVGLADGGDVEVDEGGRDGDLCVCVGGGVGRVEGLGRV